MITGRIEKEHRISEIESLVLMHLLSDDAVESYFVGVAIHPPDVKVSFRSAEKVSFVDATTLFNLRTMFNGRQVDKIIHPENAIVVDAKHMQMQQIKTR